MIIVTSPGIADSDLDRLVEHVERAGMQAHVIRGEQRTIIGCIGDDARLAEAGLVSLPGVERVMPVLTPYKHASREFALGPSHSHMGDASGTVVGGKEIVAMPAFSVIMFEVTVLIGALSTVAGLFITGGLPRLGRPEALYHPSFTSDRFGVFVHVAPEHYDEVRTIMNASGSEEVLLDQG